MKAIVEGDRELSHLREFLGVASRFPRGSILIADAKDGNVNLKAIHVSNYNTLIFAETTVKAEVEKPGLMVGYILNNITRVFDTIPRSVEISDEEAIAKLFFSSYSANIEIPLGSPEGEYYEMTQKAILSMFDFTVDDSEPYAEVGVNKRDFTKKFVKPLHPHAGNLVSITANREYIVLENANTDIRNVIPYISTAVLYAKRPEYSVSHATDIRYLSVVRGLTKGTLKFKVGNDWSLVEMHGIRIASKRFLRKR